VALSTSALAAIYLRCHRVEDVNDPQYNLAALHKAQEDFIDELRGTTPAQHHALTRVAERLPVRHGGLGMSSHIDTAPHAYKASFNLAARVCKKRHGLGFPSALQTPFNTPPPQPLLPRDPDEPLSQKALVEKHVHAPYLKTILDHHASKIPQAQALERSNPTVNHMLRFVERKGKVARAWLEPASPGTTDSSMLLSNLDAQAALCRWSFIGQRPDLVKCYNCGLELRRDPGALYAHTSHCSRLSSTTRHTILSKRIKATLNALLDFHGLSPPVESEQRVGTKTSDNGTTSEAYSDITISNKCGITGVTGNANGGAQHLDFAIIHPVPSHLNQFKATDSDRILAWTTALLDQRVKQYIEKVKDPHYARVTFTIPGTSVIPLVMSAQGHPSTPMSDWMHSLPPDLRAAVRRCTSFTLLQWANRGVFLHLQRWNRV
jgi:hypothetical protein